MMSGDPSGEPLALMTAFGTAENDPLMLVAGFLGSVADWQDYEDDWTALLREFGLKPRPLEAMIDALRALSAAERRAVVGGMASLMTRHALFGRGAFIRAADF